MPGKPAGYQRLQITDGIRVELSWFGLADQGLKLGAAFLELCLSLASSCARSRSSARSSRFRTLVGGGGWRGTITSGTCLSPTRRHQHHVAALALERAVSFARGFGTRSGELPADTIAAGAAIAVVRPENSPAAMRERRGFPERAGSVTRAESQRR